MVATDPDQDHPADEFARELRDLVAAAAEGGQPSPALTLREMLRRFGYQRRSQRGLAAIGDALEAAGLYPDLDIGDRQIGLDRRVRFSDRPFWSGQITSFRRRLCVRTQLGGVTLIVGAGLSLPYGIPNWTELAKRVWDAAFPGRPSPWTLQSGALLETLPQFLPIVFEMAGRHLEELEDGSFDDVLRRSLYRTQRPLHRRLEESTSSLSVVARLLVREYLLGGERRIRRVVTFNVDDLLERATRFLAQGVDGVRPTSGGRPRMPVRPVAGPRSELRYANPLPRQDEDAIPVIHLHGYVPTRIGRAYDFSHRLVFTDSQYWKSGNAALSYANRVMGAALSDGCCVFLGTSMTDINLLRWLSLHETDIQDEWRVFHAQRIEREPNPGTGRYRPEIRHFWVRPDEDDATGFMTAFLRERGIGAVAIDSWEGPWFGELVDQAFPLVAPANHGQPVSPRS